MGNTLPQKEIRTKEGTYLDYDCGRRVLSNRLPARPGAPERFEVSRSLDPKGSACVGPTVWIPRRLKARWEASGFTEGLGFRVEGV